MKRVAFVLTALVLSISLAMAGGAKDASGSAKPYAGKTLTVLYMSSVYADAARQMAKMIEIGRASCRERV